MPDDQHSAEHAPRVAATAGNGPEAEMMCQILASEGIPAMQQRSIDNPEFGAGGPRNVLVKASDLERARDALGLEPAQLIQPKGIDPKTSTPYEQRLHEAGGEFITAHDKAEAAIREAVRAGMSAETISDASGLSPETVRAFLQVVSD
jgi:hypothetical protein